ncbi:MAG: HisS family protein [Chloroflexota bacterium]
MLVERCKGSKDSLPGEMARFRRVEDVFRDSCRKWGYGEVRTPTIEYLHLFTSTGTLTPEMLGRVYSFLDWDGWSGERVVLRPDGTIPVARLYIDSLVAKGPARLCYVTNVFTFEPTGRENREKWQLGAEFIGNGSYLADVELITLALEVLARLGLKDIEIRLSHAGIIGALLQKAGLGTEEEAKLFDSIAAGKLGALGKLKSSHPKLERGLSLLGVKGKSAAYLKNLKALFADDFPEIGIALDNFIATTGALSSLGMDYEIDIATGRGFEYYTGTMFQISSCGVRVGGGGRYDALIPLMGGKDTPASGFALYLDSIVGLLGQEVVSKPVSVLIKVSPDNLSAAFTAARCLREAGYVSEFATAVSGKTDGDWLLEVGKGGTFKLTYRKTRRKYRGKSLDEIVSRLGKRRHL